MPALQIAETESTYNHILRACSFFSGIPRTQFPSFQTPRSTCLLNLRKEERAAGWLEHACRNLSLIFKLASSLHDTCPFRKIFLFSFSDYLIFLQLEFMPLPIYSIISPHYSRRLYASPTLPRSPQSHILHRTFSYHPAKFALTNLLENFIFPSLCHQDWTGGSSQVTHTHTLGYDALVHSGCCTCQKSL